MANNNYIPNSFQVPNLLVDSVMLTLSEFELKCYLMVIRKTIGWNKISDAISISQFQEKIEVKDPRTIKTALKNLVSKKLIIKKEIIGRPSLFSINLEYDPLHGDVPPPPTSPCTPQSNNINTNTKHTI